jgi:cyclic beta-1,2-glucan synthetase
MVSQPEILARQLAAEHSLHARQSPTLFLLKQLRRQKQSFEEAYEILATTTDEELIFAGATEWILDNYYVVRQALRQVEEDLPPNYYRELPALDSHTLYQDYPRTYAIARELVLFESYQLNIERLERFLYAYQEESALTMGELWALPLLLRFSILEALVQAVGRLTHRTPQQDLPPALRFDSETVDNDAVVANCVGSLRLLATLDWEEFFETVSVVERTLRQDPIAVYESMDFDSRDLYRKAVETLALRCPVDEPGIARVAISLASAGAEKGYDSNGQMDSADWAGLFAPAEHHVGYYLLDARGRSELEARVGYRKTFGEAMNRWVYDHPTLVYVGSNTLITLLIIMALAAFAATAGGTGWELGLVALLSLAPAAAIAISLVNWLITRLIQPRALPKLDFEKGVPALCRTMVVIPTLLIEPDDVAAMLNQLELHYLRNSDPHVSFALLTDFADSDSPDQPADELLLDRAVTGLKALNAQYDQHPFYLFHRRRLWNPVECQWMGWERKRGKLHEFNRLLRGDMATSFNVQEGELDRLAGVRYVITLDADTILPRQGAHRLIGALAHPLNQAVIDPASGRVTAGYGILQPRTEILPTGANTSLFTQVFVGEKGIDLYSHAASDVYQDLFGEGIYVGKGIYEVNAFEQSLAGRIPENRLLSHDLFEGIFARAGLVSDIVLYEEFPSQYLVFVKRSNRWIRGDWQLLPWLLPVVPAEGGWKRNDLPVLGLWKIADNLRRSLQSPGLFLFLLAGWTLFPGSPFLWTAVGVAAPAFALLTGVLSAIAQQVSEPEWKEVRQSLRDNLTRWILQIAFLVFETLLVLEAVGTTLWRMLVSRRHMLQWRTAAATEKIAGDDSSLAATHRTLLPSLILALLAFALVYLVRPAALPAALPVIMLWLAAGLIAHGINRPEEPPVQKLSTAEVQGLRRLARRTWTYYEQHVGPVDHWLPPDNFQEWPGGVVGHRTSPTNIGLYLLSVVAAWDLGYISLTHMILRFRSAFETMQSLERYRGHFLNWIDTVNLRPLQPRYVSTVDSGNLAASFIVLEQSCLEAMRQPLWRAGLWDGLLDALSLADESLRKADITSPGVDTVRDGLKRLWDRIEAEQDQPDGQMELVIDLTDTGLPQLVEQMVNLFSEAASQGEWLNEWRVHTGTLQHVTSSLRRELDMLFPWVITLRQRPSWFDAGDTPESLTLLSGKLSDRLAQIPGEPYSPDAYMAASGLVDEISAILAIWKDARAPAGLSWCRHLRAALHSARLTSSLMIDDLAYLAREAASFVNEMDFSFLFNKARQVFHIGYNLESERLDESFYDLLASEARIASVVAIAKGDVPESHWLHLSRPLTQTGHGLALLSWSGTMFEYLMPPLLMRRYRSTLLEESLHTVVQEHINYANEHSVPWGISESGFYAFDSAQNYQYRAFGVPSLGFKRGLSEKLVIAPYASLIALGLRPRDVFDNIDHLVELGGLGMYGLYEAIDFTPTLANQAHRGAVVRSYMAHHQGMIMLALLNYLQDNQMVRRFHANSRIQSIELLLQEQLPPRPQLELPPAEGPTGVDTAVRTINADPWPVPASTPMPQLHVLSNGKFNTFITNAGAGYSAMGQDYKCTRWRADVTQDDWGSWLYIQDIDHNHLWSAGVQPVGHWPESLEVQFYPHMAHFRRHDFDILLQMEIVVAPEDDIEIRRISLTNDTEEARRLRLTSYGEVVLSEAGADRRHQAFAKLFVESEYIPELNALIFRRRPRSAKEPARYLGHMLVAQPGMEPTRAYESDRMAFIGRNRTARNPAALTGPEWLTGSIGATLDPIMSLGQEMELEAYSTAEFALLTFTADTREGLLALAGRYQNWSTIGRTPEQARNFALRQLHQLDMPVDRLAAAQKLLSLLYYPHPVLRAPSEMLAENERSQPALWSYSISGDYPILLFLMADESAVELLEDILRAHTYWRWHNVLIDVVILNQRDSSYEQPLGTYINRVIDRMEARNWVNQRGGIFVLRQDQMPRQEIVLLHAAGRVILNGAAGSLNDQLARILEQPPSLPDLTPVLDPASITETTPPLRRPDDLLFDNGYGGFSPDGKAYVIDWAPDRPTPVPWINVVANEQAGFIISESGGGFTWAVNSGENRLTTWRNDPVSDMPSEALYLRDEETVESWSPMPQPMPADGPYLVRHSAGHTSFEHHSHRLKQLVRLFMAPDDPVKIIQVELENTSQLPRRLTLTLYTEWVLGSMREESAPFIIPAYHQELDMIQARNPYSLEFSERVAFVAPCKRPHGLTTDRTEFLGRLGSLSQPAALRRLGLSNRIEPGVDPCAAITLHIDLPPGGNESLFFLIGQGENEAAAIDLVERYRTAEQVAAALQAAIDRWEDILTSVQVETPDMAMNLLLNRWLLYQALSCRIWGRSALYQSSGAYGFRDQLQDSLALIYSRPDIARDHLIRAAAHQFEAGDVLHWWHPPSGRGVRTRISDDLAWLPYVTAHYVRAIGDVSVLDERAPYLTGPQLEPGEAEHYGHYETAETDGTIYDHCLRALRHASTAGPHGLPLIGGGDWNDGMNRVGIAGRGESVWLAWFLYRTLLDFADVCDARGDDRAAAECRAQAEAYRQAAEHHAWDGEWYRRAYYDDGTPVGSKMNLENQIDSLPQSWAVLSGAGDPQRARQALDAVIQWLVDEENKLILLFTPPYDQTEKDPGYIKGYLPGVRENGGQYTHAALWTIWAYVDLGQGDTAEQLFRLINPVYHSDTREAADIYKVEPYVIAADVYSLASHKGRGGWTWYTGSSGWMYRLGVEGILGLRRHGDMVNLEPCLPDGWPGFRLTYRYRSARYHFHVRRASDGDADQPNTVDGVPMPDGCVRLQDDGADHEVEVII